MFQLGLSLWSPHGQPRFLPHALHLLVRENHKWVERPELFRVGQVIVHNKVRLLPPESLIERLNHYLDVYAMKHTMYEKQPDDGRLSTLMHRDKLTYVLELG